MDFKSIKTGIMNGVYVGVGVVSQQFVKKQIPINDQLVLNGSTAVLGVILAMQKNNIIEKIGIGMIGGSALGVAQTLSPNLIGRIAGNRMYSITRGGDYSAVGASWMQNESSANMNLVGNVDNPAEYSVLGGMF
jgi:lysozyme family protein